MPCTGSPISKGPAFAGSQMTTLPRVRPPVPPMHDLTTQEILAERRRPRRVVPVVGVVTLLAATGAGALIYAASGGEPAATARPASAVATVPEAPAPSPPRPRPQVVKAVAPGQDDETQVATTTSDEKEGAPKESEAAVKRELDDFRKLLRSSKSARGARARVDGRGEAVAPASAPEVVAQVIAAGNQIAKKPYIYGGGHGGWRDKGYDCSGSVSFALAGAGLLDRPMASGGFEKWGAAGKGRWITTYANPGHMFMVVAGLRFDTSGANGGTRWQEGDTPGGGSYSVRHPPGL